MKNKRYSGNVIPWTNSTGVAVLSGAVVVLLAGPNGFIGIACDDIAAGALGALEVEGGFKLTALSTDTGNPGDKFYYDAANTRLTSTAQGNTLAGRLAEPKLNGDTTAVILVNEALGSGIIYSNTAASSAVTATTVETLFDTNYTIPANTLKAGDVLKIRYQGIATATNSTDTLAIKLYFGGLTGTALISHAATDVANNDVFQGEYELVVRDIGATGHIVGAGTYKSVPAAEGTMTVKDDILPSTAIDTTAAQQIGVSATWSTNNGGNSARLDVLTVRRN